MAVHYQEVVNVSTSFDEEAAIMSASDMDTARLQLTSSWKRRATIAALTGFALACMAGFTMHASPAVHKIESSHAADAVILTALDSIIPAKATSAAANASSRATAAASTAADGAADTATAVADGAAEATSAAADASAATDAAATSLSDCVSAWTTCSTNCSLVWNQTDLDMAKKNLRCVSECDSARTVCFNSGTVQEPPQPKFGTIKASVPTVTPVTEDAPLPKSGTISGDLSGKTPVITVTTDSRSSEWLKEQSAKIAAAEAARQKEADSVLSATLKTSDAAATASEKAIAGAAAANHTCHVEYTNCSASCSKTWNTTVNSEPPKAADLHTACLTKCDLTRTTCLGFTKVQTDDAKAAEAQAKDDLDKLNDQTAAITNLNDKRQSCNLGCGNTFPNVTSEHMISRSKCVAACGDTWDKGMKPYQVNCCDWFPFPPCCFKSSDGVITLSDARAAVVKLTKDTVAVTKCHSDWSTCDTNCTSAWANASHVNHEKEEDHDVCNAKCASARSECLKPYKVKDIEYNKTELHAEMVEAVKAVGVGSKDAEAFVTGALSDDGTVPADLTSKVSAAMADSMNATARLAEELAKNATALNEKTKASSEELAKNTTVLNEKTKASTEELAKNTTAVTKCHSVLVKCTDDCGKNWDHSKKAIHQAEEYKHTECLKKCGSKRDDCVKPYHQINQ